METRRIVPYTNSVWAEASLANGPNFARFRANTFVMVLALRVRHLHFTGAQTAPKGNVTTSNQPNGSKEKGMTAWK